MGQSSSNSSSGIGICGMLGVVFVTLKLCGVINWSWWWVTAPFWGGFAFVIGLLALIALFAAIATGIESFIYRKRRKELEQIRARREAVRLCNEMASRLGRE